MLQSDYSAKLNVCILLKIKDIIMKVIQRVDKGHR